VDGIGSWKGFGGIPGRIKISGMAMDIRIFDTETSEVPAATRVEERQPILIWGALAGALSARSVWQEA